MARVDIHFGGAWRLFLGTSSETIEVTDMGEVEVYIESRFGPLYRKRLEARGLHKSFSIWGNSIILLNSQPVRRGETPLLEDGDTLYLLPRAAGG